MFVPISKFVRAILRWKTAAYVCANGKLERTRYLFAKGYLIACVACKLGIDPLVSTKACDTGLIPSEGQKFIYVDSSSTYGDFAPKLLSDKPTPAYVKIFF